MKKVYSIILTALVMLAFAPAVSAQYSIDDFIKSKYGDDASIVFHNDDIKLPADKYFGYSKGISSPFSDGNYWIKLESFSVGSAQSVIKPADIVLVLDFSGSMKVSYGTGYQYDLVVESVYKYNSADYFNYDNGNTPTKQRFYLYRGKYWPVKRGRTPLGESGGYPQYCHYLYIDTDWGTFYLDDMSLTKTEPHKPNNGNTIIWNGSLFRYKNFTDRGTSTNIELPDSRWGRIRELSNV